MLAPEPSERPTVSELLAFPSVRKHRWKRRIYLVVVETMLTLVSLCQVMCLMNLKHKSVLFLINVEVSFLYSSALFLVVGVVLWV